MSHADQDAGGGDWRMQVRDMRTLSELKSPAPADEAVRRLSDRALRAAAQNPDHSEPARAAAEAELRARSIGADRWRLVVPGFIRANDLARRGDKLFFGWGRTVRVWSGWLVVLGVLALLAFAVLQNWVIGHWSGGAIAPRDFPAFASALFSAQTAAYLVINLAPVAGLVWLLSTALRQPARIAVIAPQQDATTRAPLVRFLRKELGAYGHIVLHAPAGPIRNAAAYRGAALLMANRLAMNLRAVRPSRLALRIGGAGGWAPITRALGEDSADAVIVDLSRDADATLAALCADPRRCVFVSLWGKLEDAEAALAARGIAARVHHYAPDGEIQRRRAFRAAMLAAMRATHGVSA